MSARSSRRGRRAATALGLTLLAAVTAVSAAAMTVGISGTPATLVAADALPRPFPPAFTPGAPRPLGSTRNLSHWAPVRRPTVARSAPAAAAPAVTSLSTRTPEGTRNVVAVLAHKQDGVGRAWVQLRLPALPNGTVGWVRRRALGGYGTVDTRLDVDLGRLRATLYRDGRPVLRAAVGVGSESRPTPRGEYYIRNKLTRYHSPTYGPVAFGTSARSPTETDWPAGGFVGIHGTDRPELLPGRVSHGCIRMRNADVLKLAKRMPVGTPLTIH
jgi:lipoprotein-anchoring transpeptidase ErfK/SrfK